VLWAEKSVHVSQAAVSLVGTLTDTYHAWSHGGKSASGETLASSGGGPRAPARNLDVSSAGAGRGV